MLFLVCQHVFSQATGVRISNNTACTVYLRIYGSTVCDCSSTLISAVLAINPSSTVLHPNTMTLGGSFSATTPLFISHAIVYGGQLTCPNIDIGVIGENQVVPPVSTCSFADVYDFNGVNLQCEVRCPDTRATWLNANPSCTGLARIVIN